jgi:DNA repair protein RadA/Sms
LAAIAAIATSFKNRPLNHLTLIFGEVGLAGEVRTVSQAQRRLDEAAKLGFTEAIIPQANLKGLKRPKEMKVFGVGNIGELVRVLGVLAMPVETG